MGHGTEEELSKRLGSEHVDNNGPKKRHREKTLPEKQFHIRPSLLTEMLEKKELQTVHNLFLAIMVNCIVCALLTDLIQHGTLDLGLSIFKVAFGRPWTTLKFVLALHLTPILILYPMFHLWTVLICSVDLASNWAKWINGALFLTVATIILMALYIPCHIHLGSEHLPWASGVIVAFEQLRICMKIYAFSRTNFTRVLGNLRAGKDERMKSSKNKTKKKTTEDERSNGSSDENEPKSPETHGNLRHRKVAQGNAHDDVDATTRKDLEKTIGSEFNNFDEGVLCPSLHKFLYFLYAPTLIYRDNYPRTKSRNWGFIMRQVVHSVGCIIFYNLMHQRFGYVMMRHVGPSSPLSPLELVNILYYQFMLGMAACVIGWLVLLHSTQNIFAELLMFGDRYFYKDWWNCRSMGEYHRTWNTPVQDFLYTYVYREAWENGLGKRFSWLPTVLVFVISNIFHEYAVCFVAGFFCPVMGIMFMGPGTFLTFIPNRKFPKLGNIFMLWSIILGHGFFHIIYVIEYYSRANGCPPADTPLQDFFIPRMLTCGVIQWS